MRELWQRLKSALDRTGDRLAGRYVSTVTWDPPPAKWDAQAHAIPSTDVYENDRELVVLADVPGATATTTTVHAHGRCLSLHARIPPPGGRLLHGDGVVDWHRDLDLPRSAVVEQAHCRIEHGVLRIHVPKQPGNEPVPVRVHAA